MKSQNSNNKSSDTETNGRYIGFIGPGRHRHLLPILCTFALTIVIGMRAEMLSIILYISRDFTNSQNDTVGYVFQRSTHRRLPWTPPTLEDYIENAFFLANIISSPIGGYLTINQDSSLLLGSSVVITCGLNLFLPLVATVTGLRVMKITLVLILRILQGLAEGCLIPALFGILRYWTPVPELSTIVCFAVIGVSLGPLIGLPICFAVEVQWGWGVVFYIYANLGLIWCIFWWRLVDNKPVQSKSISKQELSYILQNLKQPSDNFQDTINFSQIPWKAMLTSRAIISIFVTYAADDWTFQITSVCMQSYYHRKFSTKVDRTISLLIYPFLARSIFVPLGGVIADTLGYMTKLEWLTIRKILVGCGFSLKAIFFLSMAFVKDEETATIMLSLCLGFSGLAVAGYGVNVLEIAPIYSGLIIGIANSISTFSAILSVAAASLMVTYVKEPNGWIVALSSATGIQLFAMGTFLINGRTKLEKWAIFPVNNSTDDASAWNSTIRSELSEEQI